MDLEKNIESEIAKLSLQKVRPELDCRIDALFANANLKGEGAKKSIHLEAKQGKVVRTRVLPMLFAGFTGAAVAAAIMMIVMHYQVLSVKTQSPAAITPQVITTPVSNDLDHDLRFESTRPGYETTKIVQLGKNKSPVYATKKTQFKTVLIINPKKKMKFKVVVPKVEVKLTPVKKN